MEVVKNFTELEKDRIIEMAWEDRTPFEAILFQYNLSDTEVIALMRAELTEKSFKRWRRRVSGRKTKHAKLRIDDVVRFKCSRQKAISNNRISKR
ncbi:MAG: TIGR03643 family protein [Flavobacteriaceae bacterium]|nr:TIGR03643 family protein [Flavobacteriaceae bacterium]